MPPSTRVALAALAVMGLLTGADATPAAVAQSARIPVLVELFTSEGCSSCPPADALLRDLIATQPVAGALIVGLSEHVDYWNRLGWTDPFSDRAFSARQSAYAASADAGQVYTPQMVVDGRASFVGSDRARALAEIAAAAARPKAEFDLRWDERGNLEVRLAQGRVKAGTPIWIAIAESGLTVRVANGENANRTLTHDAVTRHLSKAGRTDRSGTFRQVVPVALAPSWRGSAIRVSAFAQETGGLVTALGTIEVSGRGTESARFRR